MTQYRIVEKYNNFWKERKFYPEIKKRLFWRNFKENKNQIKTYYNTYEEAKKFILSRIPKVLFHCVEHPNSKDTIIYHINSK